MNKNHCLSAVISFFILGATLTACSPSTKTDTQLNEEKINSLLEEALGLLYDDPLAARRIYEEALALEKDSVVWYKILTGYAQTYIFSSEVDTVSQITNRINTFFANKDNLTAEDHEVLGRMYDLKYNYFSYTTHNDSSFLYLDKAVEHFRQAKNPLFLINAFYNLAELCLRTGRYVEAISNYREAIALSDSIGTTSDLKHACNISLGHTYSDLRNFELANYYFDQAYDGIDSLIYLQDKFSYYNNRGNSYYHQDNLPEAIKHFQSAYSLVKDNPEYQYQNAIAQANLGEVYLLTDKLDSAGYYISKASAFFERVNNISALYHTETLLFELAIRKGNLKEARQIMGFFSNEDGIEPVYIRLRKRYLQNYYETVNDYTNAYKYLKENVALEDSISNTLIKMRAEETDMRYKHDAALLEQTHMIERQQSDMEALQLNRYIWIMAAIGLLLIAAFIYFYMRRQRAYLAEKHRNRIVELRMENIRNRVSPHFIFNILNHIISRFDRDDKNHQELYNLIKLMRMNLTMTEKLNLSLEEELDFVETYVLARQQESGVEIGFTIEIDKPIDVSAIEIPSMIIQIPVENSIKHGFREERDNKFIKISVGKTGTDTVIQIEDNGSGFYLRPGSQDKQSTGTGLKVLTQTIELLNSYNKGKITFTIENKTEDSGCIITYTIPENYSYRLE